MAPCLQVNTGPRPGRSDPAARCAGQHGHVDSPPQLVLVGLSTAQQLRAFGEGSLWPTKIRVDGAVGRRLARLGAGTEDGSVRPGRTPNLLWGSCEPVRQHGGWTPRTATVDCCLRARPPAFRSFCPPRDRACTSGGAVERG